MALESKLILSDLLIRLGERRKKTNSPDQHYFFKRTVVILNKYTFVQSVFVTKVHPPLPQAPRSTPVIWKYKGIFTDPTDMDFKP